ncbi:DUF4123 domain-containing protein [Shewanella woodyi]|uniref:DUF4123 domain-containing protein n=1 Tax=Shewanella woodyi (strain ATCC 51908 / MS32) TaxID=392500 RepID=B1KGR8_SHEWM|nr:DUF4123 domain-containing protein [Shewanella woodyi]ACA86787.1 hypothetical protein Swoo_2510 [Shewanella woodyi ATCC 51908]
MSDNRSLAEHSKQYDLFKILSEGSNRQVFLLVDPNHYDDFWTFWSSFQPKARQLWCYLFQESSYEALMSASPLIVVIEEGGAGETLYYWLLEQTSLFNKACILLESQCSLTELRHFWHQRISAIYPNGEQELLACYSPVVLAMLWPSLSSQEQLDFLGANTQFYLPCESVPDEEQVAQSDGKGEVRFSLLSKPAGTAAATEVIFSRDNPYRLSDSQYELLSRSQRRHRMVNDIFLRLSQYFSFELNIDQLSWLFLNSIEVAKESYPDESEFSFETFAVYRFVLEHDYFEKEAFKALMLKHDLRTSIQMFNQLNPPIYDEIFRAKQALWLAGVEQGSDAA